MLKVMRPRYYAVSTLTSTRSVRGTNLLQSYHTTTDSMVLRRGILAMSPPVLFLIFNRPNTTAQVMEAIRIAKPPRLYIAADGPRQRPGEVELCARARQIATNVDWPCELKTLFRDENLGCRLSVSGALDWFFGEEDQGIVLEDDCLPSSTFFPYCGELLERYRSDNRIMCISGNNFQRDRQVTQYSYYFSRYMHCWGWASWRRAWELYDAEMHSWLECRRSGLLRAWGQSDDGFVEYWTAIFDSVAQGKVDTWDYQWTLTCWLNNGLTCIPNVNLVSNIGFGVQSTHTPDANSALANLPTREMEFPIVHPRIIARCVHADSHTHFSMFCPPSSRLARLARKGAGLLSRVRKKPPKRAP